MAGYQWKGTHKGPDLFDATEPPPNPSCGTYPGYAKHMYKKEPACRPCKDAKNQYDRQLSNRRRQTLIREAA